MTYKIQGLPTPLMFSFTSNTSVNKVKVLCPVLDNSQLHSCLETLRFHCHWHCSHSNLLPSSSLVPYRAPVAPTPLRSPPRSHRCGAVTGPEGNDTAAAAQQVRPVDCQEVKSWRNKLSLRGPLSAVKLSEASPLQTPSFSPDSHLSPTASLTPFAVAATPAAHFALPPFQFFSSTRPAWTNHQPASPFVPSPNPTAFSCHLGFLSAIPPCWLAQTPPSTCHFTLKSVGTISLSDMRP